jgi:Glycosyl transferase family 2
VLVPAYQAAGTIGETLESALSQTLPAREVIVCDDGSTDDITSAVAPYRDRITFLRKANGGGASALNAAARVATGDFVAALDADDAWARERLEALGALSTARPDLDLLGTDAWFEAARRRIGRFNEANPFADHDQCRAILERCFLFHPAVRRRLLLTLGGFDESFPIAYDWECWIRLILDGARAGLVDQPLTSYRLRPGSLASARPASLRDRVRVLQKVQRRTDLAPELRRALDSFVADRERAALLAEAEHALSVGDPRPRRRLLALARARGASPHTRLKALMAASSPRLARWAVLERRPEGAMRLSRGVPHEQESRGRDGTGAGSDG